MHRYTVYNNIAYNNNSNLSVIPYVKDPCVFTMSLLCSISFLNYLSLVIMQLKFLLLYLL